MDIKLMGTKAADSLQHGWGLIKQTEGGTAIENFKIAVHFLKIIPLVLYMSRTHQSPKDRNVKIQ